MDIACFFLLRAFIFIAGKTFKDIIEITFHILFQFAIQWKLFDFTNFLSTHAFENFTHTRKNSVEADDQFLNITPTKEAALNEKATEQEENGTFLELCSDKRAVEVNDKKSDIRKKESGVPDILRPAKTIEIKLDIMKDYSSNIQLGIGRREEKQFDTVETKEVMAVNENVLDKSPIIQIQSNGDKKKHFKEVYIRINAAKCEFINYPDDKVKIVHHFVPINDFDPDMNSADSNLDLQITDKLSSKTNLNPIIKYADLNVGAQSNEQFSSRTDCDSNLRLEKFSADSQITDQLSHKTNITSKAMYADFSVKLHKDDQLSYKTDVNLNAKDADFSYPPSENDAEFYSKESGLDVLEEPVKKHKDTEFSSFAEKLGLFNAILASKGQNMPTRPMNPFNNPFKETLQDPIYGQGRRHFEETKSFFLQKNADYDRYIDRNTSPCGFELLDKKISAKSDSGLQKRTRGKHVTFCDDVVRNDEPLEKKVSGDVNRIGAKVHDILKKIQDRETAKITLDENRKKMYLDLDRIKATRTFSFQQARSAFERQL